MKHFLILSLLFVTSCAFSGRSSDKTDGVTQYITGATKLSEVKNVHVINIFRAVGVPQNTVVLGKYKYYQWDYSRAVGVSTIFGGGSTTFYCKLSAETQSEKVKALTWYGNQCDIFLDRINEYFQDKLNIAVIYEEDSKQQTTAPTSKIENKPEVKPESKIEIPAAEIVPQKPVETLEPIVPEQIVK